MTSESGLASQNTYDARHIEEVLNELQQMQQKTPHSTEFSGGEVQAHTDSLRK
jgi:hypothetical protein